MLIKVLVVPSIVINPLFCLAKAMDFFVLLPVEKEPRAVSFSGCFFLKILDEITLPIHRFYAFNYRRFASGSVFNHIDFCELFALFLHPETAVIVPEGHCACVQIHLCPCLLYTSRMPVMDGISLLTRVREQFPLTKFVITSGYSDFEYARSAINLKVSDYLLKPVDPEELRTVLIKIKREFQITKTNYEEVFNLGTTRMTPAQIADLLKDFLVENYAQDINLNLIANNLNYSPSYLTKIFCQVYDCTPSKYIINLRMSKAQRMLLHNPELSIRQIGEMVGYHDQGYFSRIFKKQTGKSPFEYRGTTEA